MEGIMKPSEALKIARKKINSKYEEFICHALPDNRAGDIVREYIEKALIYKGTYWGWVYECHGINLDDNQARTGRLQWIDWMIKEYEKIGQ